MTEKIINNGEIVEVNCIKTGSFDPVFVFLRNKKVVMPLY